MNGVVEYSEIENFLRSRRNHSLAADTMLLQGLIPLSQRAAIWWSTVRGGATTDVSDTSSRERWRHTAARRHDAVSMTPTHEDINHIVAVMVGIASPRRCLTSFSLTQSIYGLALVKRVQSVIWLVQRLRSRMVVSFDPGSVSD